MTGFTSVFYFGQAAKNDRQQPLTDLEVLFFMKFPMAPLFCVNAAQGSAENTFNDELREENSYRLKIDEV